MAFRDSKEKRQPWGKGPGSGSSVCEPAQKLPRENLLGPCIPASSLGRGGALGQLLQMILQAWSQMFGVYKGTPARDAGQH